MSKHLLFWNQGFSITCEHPITLVDLAGHKQAICLQWSSKQHPVVSYHHAGILIEGLPEPVTIVAAIVAVHWDKALASLLALADSIARPRKRLVSRLMTVPCFHPLLGPITGLGQS
jgi:hypothetical protein